MPWFFVGYQQGCRLLGSEAKDLVQVSFRLEFEFSRSVFLDHVRVILEASSDGEEVTLADNFNDIFHPLKYEADLLFTRDSNPSRCEIKADLSLEVPGNIGPPFNFTFQIQNLGFFPVRDLQLNIEIPEMTKNGNQLLQISDFNIDQTDGTRCIPPQHVAQSRASPEDLSRVSRLNHSNTLPLPVQCTVNLNPYREVSVRIRGALRLDALHALRFKVLELVTSASVELPPSSPMFLHEERPVRHLGFFQRQKRREEDEQETNGKEEAEERTANHNALPSTALPSTALHSTALHCSAETTGPSSPPLPCPLLPTSNLYPVARHPSPWLPTSNLHPPCPWLPTSNLYPPSPWLPTSNLYPPCPWLPTSNLYPVARHPSPWLPTSNLHPPCPWLPTSNLYPPCHWLPTSNLYPPCPWLPTSNLYPPCPWLPTSNLYPPCHWLPTSNLYPPCHWLPTSNLYPPCPWLPTSNLYPPCHWLPTSNLYPVARLWHPSS
ncbi:unnamed protein product [Coregonus sp. 'balchen']|nr:unnamed protein product [Coregonus sp. 'balchen']